MKSLGTRRVAQDWGLQAFPRLQPHPHLDQSRSLKPVSPAFQRYPQANHCSCPPPPSLGSHPPLFPGLQQQPHPLPASSLVPLQTGPTSTAAGGMLLGPKSDLSPRGSHLPGNESPQHPKPECAHARSSGPPSPPHPSQLTPYLGHLCVASPCWAQRATQPGALLPGSRHVFLSPLLLCSKATCSERPLSPSQLPWAWPPFPPYLSPSSIQFNLSYSADFLSLRSQNRSSAGARGPLSVWFKATSLAPGTVPGTEKGLGKFQRKG